MFLKKYAKKYIFFTNIVMVITIQLKGWFSPNVISTTS